VPDPEAEVPGIGQVPLDITAGSTMMAVELAWSPSRHEA
jgi:hypothetical protein